MTTSRIGCPSFLVKHAKSVLLLVVSLFAIGLLLPASTAHAQKKPQTVANKLTKYILVNLTPGGTYDVSKNSNAFSQINASSSGSITFNDDSDPGDQYLIVLNGVSIQPPSAPTGLTAQGDDQGCALVAWNANPENDITGYTIYWGTSSGAYDDSLEVATLTSRNVCGFAAGTYYFALRAKNSFNLLSGLSSETTADITTGNTQGPTPPQNVQASEGTLGCVDVTWNQHGGPNLAGFTVYWGGQAGTYTDSATVSSPSATSHTQCGFAQGTYYFAVRAFDQTPEYSAYSTERIVNVVGPDTTPPTLSSANPANGAQGVLLDTPISFVLADGQTGVDRNSISVTINGQAAGSVAVVGNTTQFIVTATIAGGLLPPDATVTVVAAATDQASTPNSVSSTWSFGTASAGQTDTTAPAISSVTPADGATDVSASTAISFAVSDGESGVDVGNIQFEVNGSAVPFLVNGNSANATITYQPSQSFAAGSTVQVDVVVCDLSTARNCSNLNLSFQIVESAITPVAGAPGQIVPNGYWVDMPDKPLEVQDLPTGWTVRIFDTAGFQVKTYQQSGGSADWAWNDFANDSGRRVTRGLYLVRVFDNGGKVQKSGKFLVQTD